uniref:VWFC domain-containing protein n=1 Tax=Oryzias latipes TaxID=8090 RepID=A0A3B3I1Q4_ORYLA
RLKLSVHIRSILVAASYAAKPPCWTSHLESICLPQPCQECTCYSDLTVCRQIHCSNPHCDFQKGQQLRILPNQCCPECVSLSQDSCQYEGKTYGHDSQWSPSPCSVCVCSKGRVSCTLLPCPHVTCPRNQSLTECCPKCGRKSCSWEGSTYWEGEEWTPNPCSRCVCREGKARCSVVECQPVVCRPVSPGRCCPQCRASMSLCLQHGEQWQKDDCTTCVCERGKSKCHTNTCPHTKCDKGEAKVRRDGRCCEECVPATGSCLYQDAVRYHGDMWNVTGCQFCTCNQGQVVCRTAECGRVECPQVTHLLS